VDWDAYADVCVERLLQRLDKPNMTPETLRLPTRLHVRGSCGAPRPLWEPWLEESPATKELSLAK